MDVFSIIGPVMVGPSSSHTAGAVRIGKMVRGILGTQPVEVLVKFHGSFADTYKGHGTDKAIIAGLLGYDTDDLRIRDSLELASEMGMKYSFEKANLGDVHPNTMLVEVRGGNGEHATVLGTSTGGGNIVIRELDGLPVEFTGQYHTLLILHKDIPGAVGAVTNLLGEAEVNIAFMRVFRPRRGSDALMVIEADQPVDDILVSKISALPQVIHTNKIERI